MAKVVASHCFECLGTDKNRCDVFYPKSGDSPETVIANVYEDGIVRVLCRYLGKGDGKTCEAPDEPSDRTDCTYRVRVPI